jgi:hypothetical protein
VLLDFATFLEHHVHEVWTALVDNTTPSARRCARRARDSRRDLAGQHSELRMTKPANLRRRIGRRADVSRTARTGDGGFRRQGTLGDWPGFFFPLARRAVWRAGAAVTLPHSLRHAALKSYQRCCGRSARSAI